MRSSRLALKAKAAASAKAASDRQNKQQLARERGFVGRIIEYTFQRGHPLKSGGELDKTQTVKGKILRRHETRANHYYVQWQPPIDEVEVMPQVRWSGQRAKFKLLPAKS